MGGLATERAGDREPGRACTCLPNLDRQEQHVTFMLPRTGPRVLCPSRFPRASRAGPGPRPLRRGPAVSLLLPSAGRLWSSWCRNRLFRKAGLQREMDTFVAFFHLSLN